jgi:NADH dehydrogenase (ubiquinone) 1 alpha subcomplex subunit 9
MLRTAQFVARSLGKKKSAIGATVLLKTNKTNRSEKRTVYALTDGGRSSVSGIVATVFGSTGFLGRYIVNSFGRMGSQVFVPYRGEEHATNHLRVMGDVGQVVAVKYNLLDKESIRRAMKNSNVVINLATQWWPSRNFNPHQVNVIGARNVAEVAAEMGIERFVHFSSTAADLRSDSEYYRTKAEGELAVKKAFPEATIMKPTIVSGMEDKWLNSHGSMIHYWPVYPIWEKSRRYQPIMAESVAEAVVAAVTNPETVGQTYELGGPKVYTMEELIDIMLVVTRHKPNIVNVPLGAIKTFAKMTAWHRNPRFTVDLLNDTTDRVVSDDAKTLEDLGVKHKYLEDYIQMIMRRYKKQIRFEEIVTVPNEGVEKHK